VTVPRAPKGYRIVTRGKVRKGDLNLYKGCGSDWVPVNRWFIGDLVTDDWFAGMGIPVARPAARRAGKGKGAK
jgi:hypothetical protein